MVTDSNQEVARHGGAAGGSFIALLACKRLLKTWRRGKWDTLALFEHITNAVYTPHPEHSIFVTNDQADFMKRGN
jgi:hypothetical protein